MIGLAVVVAVGALLMVVGAARLAEKLLRVVEGARLRRAFAP